MTYIKTIKTESGRYKYIHKVKCTTCGKEYERNVGNKSPITGICHCSKECRVEWFKLNRNKQISCKYCNKVFSVCNSNNKQYCSHQCYTNYVSEHVDEFNCIEKAKKMQSKANTLESIKKGLDKKRAKGLISDFKHSKELEWKAFYQICNRLTGLRRKELFDLWDGYDYYDNKYIKDNISLHYSDAEYPSLDHVIPKSECFRQGMTPMEACNVSNLVWTTRRNNSKKYNKIK
jgi:hypothetical protein